MNRGKLQRSKLRYVIVYSDVVRSYCDLEIVIVFRSNKNIYYTICARTGKALRGTAEKIKQSLTQLQVYYEKLIIKHEDFTKLIEANAEFEQEEAWFRECEEMFMNFETQDNLHLENTEKQEV